MSEKENKELSKKEMKDTKGGGRTLDNTGALYEPKKDQISASANKLQDD